MKERQILFSAPMVRALLDGRKTQTRRPVKPHPSDDAFALLDHGDGWWPYRSEDGESANVDNMEYPFNCPYGKSGDHLWVRESFFAYGRWETRFSEKKKRDEWHFVDMTIECDRAYQYAAAEPEVPLAKGRGGMPGWWQRPSIFMPRAASRILLEIVSVRVERLNDCSEADARAEGVIVSEFDPSSPVFRYACLWDDLNGKGSWNSNPWVWAVEFKRIAL